MKVTQMPATGNGNYRRSSVLTPVQQIHGKSAGIDIRKLFSRFEKDDYILAGLIAVLIFEGCDDYILLSALGYLFIMGLREE